jgi:cyclophilin family peptidyl-prolyl cis-trans isomerase
MKAALIRAIGEDINSHQTLYEFGFKSDNLIIRTASVEALAGIMNSEPMKNLSAGVKKYYKNQFSPMLIEAFNSGDPGLISAASDAISNSTLDFSEEFRDGANIKNARSKLKLPRDTEASIALDKLEAKVKGKSYKSSPLNFNNPINWETFDELKDSINVVVSTSKGEFELLLYKKSAPGTVTSFVKQAKSGFFNNKVFHRIVPNFVIQTGCPRGDGYGSPDFTIRTEISTLQYNDEGWLGMASAGRDTESSQWFITLSPTPHLDGNYTIFGRVIKGMEVIRNIDMGDKINSIKIGK